MEQKKEQKINWGANIANHPHLEREITIKLNPKKILKGFVVVAVLLLVFFAGRLSVGPDSGGFSGFAELFGGTSAAVAEETSEEVAEETAIVEETELVEETVVEEESEAVVEEEEDEEIVSTYDKVFLAVNEVYKEWKGTYGKMKGFEFTIKNGEEGTILPSYFVMTVDGYDDIEKRFDVPYDAAKVKGGETLTAETAISGGFMYNPATINIDQAKIKIYLYDTKGGVMALSAQQFDLSEEEE